MSGLLPGEEWVLIGEFTGEAADDGFETPCHCQTPARDSPSARSSTTPAGMMLVTLEYLS